MTYAEIALTVSNERAYEPAPHKSLTFETSMSILHSYTQAAMPLSQRTWSFAVCNPEGTRIDSPKGRKD